MRTLLDTCVLSELNKSGDSAKRVRQAISDLDDEAMFISVVSLGEIAKGVGLLDEGARKRGLLSWLNGLELQFVDRLLPVDHESARIWGELTARAQRQGRVVHVADGLIAATALRHGLHVMTRNISDFEPTGALLTNPWHDY